MSAQAAYVGLITDTGKFQFQNTDHNAFLAASEMVACGAEPARTASLVYESKSLGALAMEARLVERIKVTNGGKIAYSWVSHKDFLELSVKEDETEGLVGVLRELAGPSIVILFREHKDHIRCNIRAKGSADVGAIAREFGGGGHVAAAGFTCKGELDEAIASVLPTLLKLEAQL
jgi:phosphoesterase RecJ-like protein